MRRILFALIALVFVPPASAAAVQLEPDAQLLLETTPTLQAGVFDFDLRFVVDANRSGYLKVLPVAGNPVHRNGTIDATGWWTEVLRAGQRIGATNGSTIVELGSLAAGRHEFQLRVHTPAGAVRDPGELRLKYALAVRGDANGSGSGGNLDPSISLQPVLRIQEAPLETEENGATSNSAFRLRLPPFAIWGALGVAALALVFWAGRRSAKGGGKQ